MPKQLDSGDFVINQQFNDGEYIKSEFMQTMLKDIERGLNDMYIPGSSAFQSIISLPQMTNVPAPRPGQPLDAVPFGTPPSGLDIPVNGIIMYSYESFYKRGLPQNFEMCDGNNGTPDLKAHFMLDYFYIKRTL